MELNFVWTSQEWFVALISSWDLVCEFSVFVDTLSIINFDFILAFVHNISEGLYLQCWTCSRWCAWDPYTYGSASWACTCTGTFLSADQHVQTHIVNHLTVGMHRRCSVGTGRASRWSALSAARSLCIDGKLEG